jgi:hypothetical protein
LHRPVDASDLAEKLAHLLTHPHEADELGRRGRAAVVDRYHASGMAEATRRLYRSMLARHRR